MCCSAIQCACAVLQSAGPLSCIAGRAEGCSSPAPEPWPQQVGVSLPLLSLFLAGRTAGVLWFFLQTRVSSALSSMTSAGQCRERQEEKESACHALHGCEQQVAVAPCNSSAQSMASSCILPGCPRHAAGLCWHREKLLWGSTCAPTGTAGCQPALCSPPPQHWWPLPRVVPNTQAAMESPGRPRASSATAWRDHSVQVWAVGFCRAAALQKEQNPAAHIPGTAPRARDAMGSMWWQEPAAGFLLTAELCRARWLAALLQQEPVFPDYSALRS